MKNNKFIKYWYELAKIYYEFEINEDSHEIMGKYSYAKLFIKNEYINGKFYLTAEATCGIRTMGDFNVIQMRKASEEIGFIANIVDRFSREFLETKLEINQETGEVIDND